MVRRLALDEEIVGSSPTIATMFASSRPGSKALRRERIHVASGGSTVLAPMNRTAALSYRRIAMKEFLVLAVVVGILAVIVALARANGRVCPYCGTDLGEYNWCRICDIEWMEEEL